MPIREYKCIKCEHVDEVLIVGDEDNPTHARYKLVISCSKCGDQAFRIIISQSSFRLKAGGAGGFYSPSRG